MNRTVPVPTQSSLAPDYSDASSEAAFSIDFERYLAEARSLRYWIAAILALAFIAALLATVLSTKLYRANARIEVSQLASNVTDIDPLENESQVSERQYLNTQYELLTSRFMADRVIEAGNLTRYAQFLDAFGVTEEEVDLESAVQEILVDNITINAVSQSALVDIYFSSASPELSATVANLWAEEFIAANYEKRFGQNIEAREYLNQQIDELRQALSASEKALVDYARSNEILVLDATSNGASAAQGGQTLIA